jgi:hypothetical protein
VYGCVRDFARDELHLESPDLLLWASSAEVINLSRTFPLVNREAMNAMIYVRCKWQWNKTRRVEMKSKAELKNFPQDKPLAMMKARVLHTVEVPLFEGGDMTVGQHVDQFITDVRGDGDEVFELTITLPKEEG